MPLSRLDNFLKNVRGNIIYVNPNDLDATDAVENQGNSRTSLCNHSKGVDRSKLGFHISKD